MKRTSLSLTEKSNNNSDSDDNSIIFSFIPTDIIEYLFLFFGSSFNIFYILYAVNKKFYKIIHSFGKRNKIVFCSDKLPIYCATWGYLNILKWQQSYFPNSFLCVQTFCATAAQNGHLDILKWFKEKYHCVNHNAVSYAAFGGHLHILEWIKEQEPNTWNTDKITPVEYASQEGNLEIIKWLYNNEFECNGQTLSRGISKGHFKILEWYIEIEDPIKIRRFYGKICSSVAKSGNLEKLKWLISENQFVADEATSVEAAGEGHLHILNWLIEKNHINYILNIHSIIDKSIQNKKIETIKWLMDYYEERWFDPGLANRACTNGFLEFLQLLQEKKCYKYWDLTTMQSIAKKENQKETLKWIDDNFLSLLFK